MAPPPPLSHQHQQIAYGPKARLLGVAHYGDSTALTFAVGDGGKVIRLRIENYEAARLATQVLPPEYRPIRPARRRRGLFPARRTLLFGDARDRADGRTCWLPEGMHFIPSGSEHQANESGNLGKGLPNNPDNVPENRNIGAATAACRLDPRNLSQPLVSVAPGIVRGIDRASYQAEALEFFRSVDPARNSRAQAEECTASLPRSPSNSRQGD